MTRRVRSSTSSVQVNVTLDPHWRLVLRLAAEADGQSVPDLLRPVVVRYLRSRLRNEDLAEAVSRMEKIQQSRHTVPDNVTPLGGQGAPRPSRRGGTREGGSGGQG